MKRKLKKIKRSWRLYLLLFLPLAWLIIFRYIPMIGVSMAFEDFSMRKGFFGSSFVGLKYFRTFFNASNFKNLVSNVVILSFYQLLVGFPIPIILALALNECQNQKLKKFIQCITFGPYFVSVVVLVSMLSLMFHVRFGIFNVVLQAFGFKAVNVMGEANTFRHLYVWSGVWQSAGYNAVLYIAALSSIDPELREAATIDGASRWQKIRYVDIPGIMPTITITFILAVGNFMSLGFDKAYIMQTPSNLSVSEIISTYIYKIGIQNGQYSYAAAIGIFNSVINFVLITIVNKICRKWGETSLW